MENELLKAKEEMEVNYWALIGQAQDGVIIIQNTIVKFANQAMSTLTGFAVKEMVSRSVLDLVTAEYRDLVAQVDKLSTKGEDAPVVYEIQLQSKEGVIKNVEISAGVIQYKGKPASMALIRDITQRKRMEEELQKAQKLESLELLAGGIAHDFKNLLSIIIGSFYLAKLHITPEDKINQVLDRAEKAASQARDLSQQLLTFAKGGAPLKKLSSISKLLEDTAELSIHNPKVKNELVLPADLWPVYIDQGQISQVMNNLIINAAQAMPEGGTIRICAKNVIIKANDGLPLRKGEYVKLCVKDQGIGIPKEHLQKIFDPYFTTKKTGNGLGLATTYSTINKHDGYIAVDSQIGLGTTFFVYLPSSRDKIFFHGEDAA